MIKKNKSKLSVELNKFLMEIDVEDEEDLSKLVYNLKISNKGESVARNINIKKLILNKKIILEKYSLPTKDLWEGDSFLIENICDYDSEITGEIYLEWINNEGTSKKKKVVF